MDPNQLDTLNKYGTEFQNKCIAVLLMDRIFLERILDIISPDYFETTAQKWLVDQSVKYFIEYRDIITPTVLLLKIQELDDQMKLLKQSIGNLVHVVYEHFTDNDLKYVKEKFLEFCKTRALAKAILTSVDLLKKGDYDSIKTTIDNALKAGIERNLGHDYVLDVDQRMSKISRNCVKTNWDIIDQLLDGGLGKGELGFIVAPSGAGKSWMLARLGAEGLKQGKNILHVTLELNENYVGLRYDAYFSNIPFQNIRENIDKVKDAIKNIPGKLFIKYFPLKTISAMSIKLFIERLQLISKINIDMLIVDYADILKPVMYDRNASAYSEAGSVYEELRSVAGELQIPVWSASQSNRSGHEKEVVSADNVADSYRKIMTGDFIMSLSRKKEDKEIETGRIHVVKNRFGADGFVFPCKFNASTGHIKIYPKSSGEGLKLLGKMDDHDKGIHKIAKTLWEKQKPIVQQENTDKDQSDCSDKD